MPLITQALYQIPIMLTFQFKGDNNFGVTLKCLMSLTKKTAVEHEYQEKVSNDHEIVRLELKARRNDSYAMSSSGGIVSLFNMVHEQMD
ncbi:hypothetical protein MTR_7g056163 [Medicago truncatula]|uniref:Uncharacterized protein n=1 Tax=Medicago truncatula TaxID=3880 RepID=A0A072U9V5_MEDTR|nr:hypothetical protein MTR_7g056163 [Medicago truncatula]